MQPLIFHEFLASDGRVLIFTGATRNSELMSVVKMNQSHEISWIMPKSRETFILTGRLFIVCAPTLSHRFGSVPRNIVLPSEEASSTSTSQDEFWETARMRLWRRLTPQLRASWSWPPPGDHKGPGPSSAEWSAYRDIGTVKPAGPLVDTGFKYLKLDVLDEPGPSSSSSPVVQTASLSRHASTSAAVKVSPDDEYRYTYNSALDNFCLLVFKASRVDHWSPGSPPSRMIYSANKDGAWLYEE
ncbi:hypothetical protein HK405_016056, partial [Cladochytrium tenue]